MKIFEKLAILQSCIWGFALMFLTAGVWAADTSSGEIQKEETRTVSPESEQTAKPEVSECAACGKPCLKRWFIVRGEKFCSETCLSKKYFCSRCGVTVGNQKNREFTTLVDISETELFFCKTCAKVKGCAFCGSRKGTRKLKDGRISCSVCRERAVWKTEEAIPLLKKAQEMLHEHFGFPSNPNIPMKVMPYAQFMKELSASGVRHDALALHQTHFSGETLLSADEKTLYIDIHELDSRMLVLAGSPKDMVFDSIVHELTHEYLRRTFYHFDDPKIEEGFCESMAAACSIFNERPTLALRKLRNPDPIYGDGFRLIYSKLQDEGWEAVMRLLKENSLSKEEYVRQNLEKVLNDQMLKYLKERKLKPKLKFGPIPEI